MYFLALAVDYDGTLADEGTVKAKTIEALIKIKESGRKLIMVTGRQIDDLKQVFNRLDLFDCIVAENGALIYNPKTESQNLLAGPPSEQFLSELITLGVKPLSIGKIIVSTLVPHEKTIIEVIRNMGLELEIIFNKGFVMVLPSGVNKATGLSAALKEIGLSFHNVVGIGDAENDHAFLQSVGLGVAVDNAYEAVKQSAGVVTKGSYGQGVEELIEKLLIDESSLISMVRNKVSIGSDPQNIPVEINPIDRILITGTSGIGKSTLATALTEKMVSNGFQFCIFDPEGDYEKLENAISVGDAKSPPSLDHILELLQDPSRNVIVNTLGIELKDRPSFFVQLIPRLISLKASSGHPHWLIIDEAHHMLPAAQESPSIYLPKEGTIFITVHPDEIAAEVLKSVNIFIILGPKALAFMNRISKVIGVPLPKFSIKAPNEDEVFLWQLKPNVIKTVKAEKPKQQHKRHTRKYAEGDLSEETSFYFRGPNEALNLRAQNLMIFLQIAEGVDDATWMHHLRKKDYSEWFKNCIKDDHLSEAASQIEGNLSLSALESRQAMGDLIKELYTGPASTSI